MTAGVRRVLGVFAHPDDECLLAGGTLAACHAAGMETAVLCLCRGEAGPRSEALFASELPLGEIRERELRAACSELGVGLVEVLDYPDGELYWQDREGMANDIAGMVRDFGPDVVITFGPEGLYWHRDHIAVHEATQAAVEDLAGARPVLYDGTWPSDLAANLVATMEDRGLPAGLWGLHPSVFGVEAGTITTVVDVRPFVGQKMRALRLHRSQLEEDHLLSALPEEIAEATLGWEYFVRRSGLEGDADPLAALSTGVTVGCREIN